MRLNTSEFRETTKKCVLCSPDLDFFWCVWFSFCCVSVRLPTKVLRRPASSNECLPVCASFSFKLLAPVHLSVSVEIQTHPEQGKNNTWAGSYTALCVVWILRSLSCRLLLHYTLTCNLSPSARLHVCVLLVLVFYARTQNGFKNVCFSEMHENLCILFSFFFRRDFIKFWKFQKMSHIHNKAVFLGGGNGTGINLAICSSQCQSNLSVICIIHGGHVVLVNLIC